ncbi:hypothetical protein [Nocardioides panacisoli]|uniref:Tetracyclin repressor-like C-terminal domain-containing protein n=1 Tax=Nocardioides panacisoli TaxID=627624 RepID=A0ABP7J527_9ACTN
MRSLDPTEDLAITLVRRFLVLCEHPRSRDRMLRVVSRSMQPGADAPRVYRWLNRAMLTPRMQRGGRTMSAMKWELVASQLFAVATMRYLLELEPIASAARDDVVTMAAPGVLAVLQGTDVFSALVVDEDEDLSDLGDTDDLAEVEEPRVRGRRLPGVGAVARRAARVRARA